VSPRSLGGGLIPRRLRAGYLLRLPDSPLGLCRSDRESDLAANFTGIPRISRIIPEGKMLVQRAAPLLLSKKVSELRNPCSAAICSLNTPKWGDKQTRRITGSLEK
jgi:hypothetical protein